MSGATINEQILENKLIQLEEARSWSPRVISRLETMIRTGDDYDLFRINPLQYAADKNMAESEAIDLFLYSAKFGLFEMEWHLVCAFCAHVVESLRDLSNLHSHFKCNFCAAENDISMDDYIQVAFTISPQVRAISFHQADSLPIEDYYFRYHFAKGVQPLPDGTPYLEVAEMLTRHMQYVEPDEKIVIETEIMPGMLQAKDLYHRTSVVFFLQEHQSDLEAIPIHLEEGQFVAKDRQLKPAEIVQPAATFRFDQTDELDSGKVKIEYTNLMEKRSPLLVVHYPAGFQSMYLSFDPFLSGKRLLTTQTFRDLFRSEVLQTDEGIGVKDITFLFTDLKGSTEMYDRVGDAKAYYLVRQHFDTLNNAITNNSGAIVKTIGDAVMATFMTPKEAVQAAIDMIQGLNEFNTTISEDLFLKIGIHRGHSIVVTLNDRLDYFGQTVNIAARVQGLAGANEIYLTHDVHTYPGVDALLGACEVVGEEANLKGVSGKVPVCKVTLIT